ncbi:MAG: cysteine--tRNA ligase, partial [Candidatus Omnitrophica bacterium]|nr:cysteine--tRNA ligase [Candidatus Omnitrophota bacterium]
QVKFVRNVTDVDDKIIEKAKNEFKGEALLGAVKKVAEKYLAAYHGALDSLGIKSGSPEIIEPKASEYIEKMVGFIKNLITRGVAYQAGGDVYFDITKAAGYGKLSGQSLEKMESGARVAPLENKKNPLDFALWKSAKENEPSWPSPWGPGRPGWHIECSVMSSDILGDEFDIHGGGLDLIFPHHENEIAQSEGAEKKFARIWMHHGLLTINGQKMAKSLGNFITVKDFLDKYKYPDLLKLLFLAAHYSHPVDYTEEKIEEARQALERILILLNKLEVVTKSQGHQVTSKNFKEIEEIKNKFIEAMDDDFNTPQALAAIFELVTLANKNINDADFISNATITLKELSGILGLTLEVDKAAAISDEEIKAMILKRQKARQEKNYALSDKIRKELEEQGIILEDAGEGTTWRRKL